MLWGDAEPFDPDFSLPNTPSALSPSFAELALTIWAPFLAEKEANR